MALPNKVLPGFSAALYCQPTSTPTPLTVAQLSLVASVSPIAATCCLLRQSRRSARMTRWRISRSLALANPTRFPRSRRLRL